MTDRILEATCSRLEKATDEKIVQAGFLDDEGGIPSTIDLRGTELDDEWKSLNAEIWAIADRVMNAHARKGGISNQSKAWVYCYASFFGKIFEDGAFIDAVEGIHKRNEIDGGWDKIDNNGVVSEDYLVLEETDEEEEDEDEDEEDEGEDMIMG